MIPQKLTEIKDFFKKELHMNKARIECLMAAIVSAIEAKSILLADIADRIEGETTDYHKIQRLQRFFREVRLDHRQIALFILKLAGIDPKTPMIIALDRTNWTTRENERNILTLSVCTGDTGIPIFWKDLRCEGNSNTKERIDIMRQFTSFFGTEQIKCLVCDREFTGKNWFAWLKTHNVPFVIRLKKNLIIKTNGQKTAIKHFFQDLPNGGFLNLDIQHVCGVDLYICGFRTEKGDLIILGSHGIFGMEAANMYLRRWNIETGFSQLKTRGFKLQSSRLCGEGKMELLLSILAIAMAFCYSCGKMSESIVPIKILSHGRKSQSIFRRGLHVVYSWLADRNCKWCPLYSRIDALLSDSLAFVASVFPAGALQNPVFRRCG